ncbi:SGNH/GDSL hydrolase family protein [Nocardia mangyaensis]|uniref:SGNH/GDSL hydrolase family protein n=1 Tax=Nocardia mangyaensis TaxID=2213200 RepID=UPI002676F472|nr:SGNH/GDSL hydrolase family protein [Nocardia mangyaensis]MDO3646125.1 SGNH/GDSL hydrolase family protein [Nocardia mangyaensis]
MKSWLRAIATTSMIAAAAIVPAGAQAEPAADTGARYVALGDSGAATTGVAELDVTAPLRCVRSTVNAPTLVAERLGLPVDDRTCSSAKIPDLYTSQGPGIAPQLDALGPATEIVTLHIGANDADMTEFILGHCHAGAVTGGCAAAADPEWDRRIDAIAPAYAAALDEIARRAPRATVFVDGWPTYLTDTSCPAMLGLLDADAAYIQSKFDRLNTVVAGEAAAHGAVYLDTVTASREFGMCADPALRWFDPILADQTLLPYHPTLAGQRGVAALIVDAVAASGVLNR